MATATATATGVGADLGVVAPAPVRAVDRALHEHVLDATGLLRPVMDALWHLTAREELPALLRRGAPAPLVARPRFSVVVPSYGYARYLPSAVASALAQDGVDVEVVVVDDASTDGSLDVARDLHRAHSNVVVVRNAVNVGHVRSVNTGLECATGEYVVRLDADDLLAPGALARAAALMEAWPSVGLAYGHPRHFSQARPPRPLAGRTTWTVWQGRAWLAERCRRGVNCITTPEAVVRRAVLDEVGLLDTRLQFAQDMELWLRVAAVSDVGHVNGPDQALHRDHPGSMSATEGAGTLLDLVERQRVFEVLFEGVGPSLPDACGLAGAARQALAREALATAVRRHDRGRCDPAEVAVLLDVAGVLDTSLEQLPEWHTLTAAAGRGPRRARSAPAALCRTVRRRTHDELAYLHWTRTGL